MAETMRLAASSGVDYSSNPQSLGGLTLMATIPADPSRLGYYVQNQSAAKVYVVFDRESGDTASVAILEIASGAGEAGGYIDMSSMPHSGRIRIMCGAAGSQISSRAW